jgi:multicomponent Na+:H+ antiporter subunit E
METARVPRAAIARGIGLLVVWILIAGANPSDLPTGVIAAVLATWASLVLHPPGVQRIRFAPLMRLSLRLLVESFLAGFDVARRALDPRLPLRPGLIRYKPASAPGPTQAVFCTITSLVPGTLAVRPAADGELIVHCLDVGQPVIAGLARDEAALLSALSGT